MLSPQAQDDKMKSCHFRFTSPSHGPDRADFVMCRHDRRRRGVRSVAASSRSAVPDQAAFVHRNYVSFESLPLKVYEGRAHAFVFNRQGKPMTMTKDTIAKHTMVKDNG
jgi:hypothetical protein